MKCYASDYCQKDKSSCNLNAQNSPQEALNAQGATIPQPEQ